MAIPFASVIASSARTALVLDAISDSAGQAESSLDGVSGALQRLDDIAKTARGLGILAEDLENLQAAAGLAGLDNAERTLARFQQRIGAARLEGGRYRENFELLGLEVDNLTGSVDDLTEASEALNRVQNQGERAYLAQQVLGARSAKGLADLAESQRAATEFAKRFNLELGDTSAVERANDAWANIGRLFTSASNRIAARLAPALERIADAFADFLDEGDKFERILNAILGVTEVLANAFATVVEWLVELDRWFNRVGNSIQNAINSLGSWLGFDMGSRGGGTPEPEAPGQAANESLARVTNEFSGAALRGSRAEFSTLFGQSTGLDLARRQAEGIDELVELSREGNNLLRSLETQVI